ncbi:MAG: menaquinone biosynthetic enzyme MqnA/MqnD family protein [Flavobacteriales bacterium]
MKVKISIVSYSNTLPFLYGLQHSDILNEIDLQLDIPSKCAEKLLTNQVDIGLVPVAILPKLKEYHIITDYCIGATKKVNSVLLYSDVPLNEIETIMLDYQSITSINLVQILAKQYWKIFPKFENSTVGFEKNIGGTTAGVIIGDRTFDLSKKFLYQYDLAGEWVKFTQLPFAFACWVSNKKMTEDFARKLNEALKFGVNHIPQAVNISTNQSMDKNKLKNYLTYDISYHLDQEKRRSIDIFLNFLTENVNI